MCYRVREPDRQHDNVTQQVLPPSTSRLSFIRPRVVGALAAVLVALVATAALLLPSSTPAVSSEKAAAPVAVSNVAVPARSDVVIEQTSTTLDDGVPSSTEVARNTVRSGHCDHGL
jgi:hypothetical protein